MRIDRNLVGWGIFFIVLGAVPLLVRQGFLDVGLARSALSMWPLFLVAVGLGLLLRGTPLDWVGGLLTAATAGAIAGSFLVGGGSFTSGFCSDESTGAPDRVAGGTLTDGASMTIELPCGELHVTTSAGSGWDVSAPSDDGRGPRVTQDGDDVRIAGGEGRGFFIDTIGARPSWAVRIPRDPAIDLAVELSAGSTSVDLDRARLGNLGLSINAGSARVDAVSVASLATFSVGLNAGDLRIALPAQAVRGIIEANAGSVAICVPAGTTLRITLDDNITASHNLAQRGLVQSGDVWSSPAGSTGPTIDLAIEANAASITLDPEDGC